jgi:hypothetical protein
MSHVDRRFRAQAALGGIFRPHDRGRKLSVFPRLIHRETAAREVRVPSRKATLWVMPEAIRCRWCVIVKASQPRRRCTPGCLGCLPSKARGIACKHFGGEMRVADAISHPRDGGIHIQLAIGDAASPEIFASNGSASPSLSGTGLKTAWSPLGEFWPGERLANANIACSALSATPLKLAATASDDRVLEAAELVVGCGFGQARFAPSQKSHYLENQGALGAQRMAWLSVMSFVVLS